MASQVAHWRLAKEHATHVNAIGHGHHRMRKVKNVQYLNMLPKETIYSKYKAATVHPGSNTGGDV